MDPYTCKRIDVYVTYAESFAKIRELFIELNCAGPFQRSYFKVILNLFKEILTYIKVILYLCQGDRTYMTGARGADKSSDNTYSKVVNTASVFR